MVATILIGCGIIVVAVIMFAIACHDDDDHRL